MNPPRVFSAVACLCPVFVSALLLFSAACSPSRIQRIGNEKLSPLPDHAPVLIFDGTLDRPYKPVARVDSRRYDSKDGNDRMEMEADLRKLARKTGADAVHKIRILEIRKRGAVPDERAPIPGAWKQGDYRRYFMRGEAVRLMEDAPGAPALPRAATENRNEASPSRSKTTPEGVKQP